MLKVVALDQLQTHIVAGAIVAIIAALSVVVWMELSVRSRQRHTEREPVVRNPRTVSDVSTNLNQYLAYGSWRPVFRVVALLVVAGSVVAIGIAVLL
jgi:hypothetical protein